jgi:hypothetical protein
LFGRNPFLFRDRYSSARLFHSRSAAFHFGRAVVVRGARVVLVSTAVLLAVADADPGPVLRDLPSAGAPPTVWS